MLVYMLETRRGSEDGFVVKRFNEGVTYDVADTMGADFIRKGWALHLPEEDLEPIINGVRNINQIVLGCSGKNPATQLAALNELTAKQVRLTK